MKRLFILGCLSCALAGCSILQKPEPTVTQSSPVTGAVLPEEKPNTEEKPKTLPEKPSEEKAPKRVEAKPISRVSEDSDALSLAADALANGDDKTAAREFRRHLQKHPKQFLFRYQLAEIHFRTGDDTSAKQEFLQTIADAQEAKTVNTTLLVRCHTFLLEIAIEKKDTYSEHLHRGIGLTLLAQRITEIEEEQSENAETLLCKAIKELKKAREAQANDAQAAWYLSKCYRGLGESAQAERMRSIAKENAPLNSLPAKELREINETR